MLSCQPPSRRIRRTKTSPRCAALCLVRRTETSSLYRPVPGLANGDNMAVSVPPWRWPRRLSLRHRRAGGSPESARGQALIQPYAHGLGEFLGALTVRAGFLPSADLAI
jgi:hypothetical protein